MKPLFTRSNFGYVLANGVFDKCETMALFDGAVPADLASIPFDVYDPQTIWDNCLGRIGIRQTSTNSKDGLEVQFDNASYIQRFSAFKGSFFLEDTSMFGTADLISDFNKYITCPGAVKTPHLNNSPYNEDIQQKFYNQSLLSNTHNWTDAYIYTMWSYPYHFDIELHPTNKPQGLMFGWHMSYGRTRNAKLLGVKADGSTVEIRVGKFDDGTFARYIGYPVWPVGFCYMDLSAEDLSEYVALRVVANQSTYYYLYNLFMVWDTPQGASYDPQNDTTAAIVGTATWGLLLDRELGNPTAIVDLGDFEADGGEQVLLERSPNHLGSTVSDANDVPAMSAPQINTWRAKNLKYGGGS